MTAFDKAPDAGAENIFHALTRKCNQHQEQWCRLCGPRAVADGIARALLAYEPTPDAKAEMDVLSEQLTAECEQNVDLRALLAASEARVRELEAALAQLDLYIDFGEEFVSGDMACGYDDATGVNSAMKNARAVLAKARAEMGGGDG